MTSIVRFSLRNKNIVNHTEWKRFAGHSKWANIRHIKMEKDREKATTLSLYLKKMKVAVAGGKSTKPEENLALARVIEQAKRNSLPMATIKNVLTKMQSSKSASQLTILESRGPSGCVVLIQVLSDNIGATRNQLNTHLRKTRFSPNDHPSSNLYEHKGVILTEVENRVLDTVTEDAIEVGAEDAEIMKENENEFVQFTCCPSELNKVKKGLENLNYKIIQADEEYIPKSCVNLSDEEMELVSKLYDRLSGVEEVVKIYTNIS